MRKRWYSVNQDHALAVRDLINQMKTSKDPNYCQRVTANDGALGEQHLRDFQDNEKTIPTILTTSQKLSTGVDARNIRNIVLMRPINSIIEFKQIIGRGTRLYDGKDFFTIYDFVKAYHHFQDRSGMVPQKKKSRVQVRISPLCTRKASSATTLDVWQEPMRPPDRALSCLRKAESHTQEKVSNENKARRRQGTTIQHIQVTQLLASRWYPISAQQFMELLYGKIPEFFKDEEELRSLWSKPETRKKLLQGLAEKGFGRDQIAEMQKIIDAEKSDLFDVLAHIAYAIQPITREVRAANARARMSRQFSSKQQAFLDFVLSHYVTVGVEELDQEKLTPLLRLKYHDSISDAVADLGQPEEINQVFSGFQKYLYQQQVACMMKFIEMIPWRKYFSKKLEETW